MSIDVPTWLNPDVITPELEALRPQFTEDALFIAQTIRSLRPKLDAIYRRVEAETEAISALPDEVRTEIDKFLGADDVFGLLAALPSALDVTEGGNLTEIGWTHHNERMARALGET